MLARRNARRKPVEPHEDYGFFGPDSVTWRVWSYPTSLTIGFQRAVVVEELDPSLIAAVDETDEVRYRPRTRYDRTLRYFAIVAFGGTRSAIKASEVLVKVHAKAVGHRADQRQPLRRQRPGLAAVDPPHRLAFDPLRLRALRARQALAGGRAALLGGVRDRRRAADVRPGRRPALARGDPRVLRGSAPAAGRLRGRPVDDGPPAERRGDVPAAAAVCSPRGVDRQQGAADGDDRDDARAGCASSRICASRHRRPCDHSVDALDVPRRCREHATAAAGARADLAVDAAGRRAGAARNPPPAGGDAHARRGSRSQWRPDAPRGRYGFWTPIVRR